MAGILEEGTYPKKSCPFWQPGKHRLQPLLAIYQDPVCRYWLGGQGCSRRDIFLCETEGRQEKAED
jgi:hypothetical protein